MSRAAVRRSLGEEATPGSVHWERAVAIRETPWATSASAIARCQPTRETGITGLRPGRRRWSSAMWAGAIILCRASPGIGDAGFISPDNSKPFDRLRNRFLSWPWRQVDVTKLAMSD